MTNATTETAKSANGTLRALLSGASVEVTPGDLKQVATLAQYFATGTDVHVTYLPNGNVSETVATARALREAGFNPVPHLAARAMPSAAVLHDYLAQVVGEAGITRILLIAGDLPRAVGPYSCSLDVLKTGMLAQHGIGSLSFAGHPEGHPAAANEAMEAALCEKVAMARDQGHTVQIITQFCFETDPIFAYARRLLALGIDAPLRVGLAAPASLVTLVRYGMRCGVGNSLRALRRNTEMLGLLSADATPDRLLEEIAAAKLGDGLSNIDGVHFYIFGGLRKTGTWLKLRLQELNGSVQ